MNPALLAKTELGAVRFMLLIDSDECSTFWRNAEFMRISLETMAVWRNLVGDFIRRVELERSDTCSCTTWWGAYHDKRFL